MITVRSALDLMATWPGPPAASVPASASDEISVLVSIHAATQAATLQRGVRQSAPITKM
jgi:hypothetical protein